MEMSNEPSSGNSSVSIEELVRKAKKVGSDVVPENYDETVQQMLTVMKSSGKVLTVKQITEMFKSTGKSSKFWSDKMWNLADGKVGVKTGVLVHLSTRGHYQYNFNREPKE